MVAGVTIKKPFGSGQTMCRENTRNTLVKSVIVEENVPPLVIVLQKFDQSLCRLIRASEIRRRRRVKSVLYREREERSESVLR